MKKDFIMGSIGNSSNEQEACDSRTETKIYHRHNIQQIHTLEAFFKECPHPDDNQRRQLSKELDLEPKQIKFWFQNRRTQMKAQNERADNSILRAENERIQCENLAIREALKNVICPSCGGPPFGEEERQLSLQKLKLENQRLKEEHKNVSKYLCKYTGKEFSESGSLASISTSIWQTNFIHQGLGSLAIYNGLDPKNYDNICMERALMFEAATNAMDELVRLLQTNEPLWVKLPSDERYVIQRDNYERTFPKAIHLQSPSARIESSKDSALVTMNAIQLVDIFLDADKWIDIFPTIVTKAKTIQVLETGMVGNRHGSLQLMYAQMHILSPFVAPREFYFLRHCQQVKIGLWVLVDVSYTFTEECSQSWKLPSGCMIQEMPNGYSKVTWVEHVEVDDKAHIHRLYRDLICGSSAYGSKLWITTLQRMCERLAVSNGETKHIHDFRGDSMITSLEGGRSVMKLAQRMVKSFCSVLNMSNELDFPQLSDVNNSGVRVSVRQSTDLSQPNGVIVNAATSFWLPLPCQSVFSLLTDEKMRVQWDVLWNGNLVNEIAKISIGNTSGNCISILCPFVPSENNMMILQETSCIEPLGYMVVYAPISTPAMKIVLNGEDASNIPILPSGFVVSNDGHHPEKRVSAHHTSGSLLTIAFQILVSSPSSAKELNIQSVATVNTLISSTVQRIKALLKCST